ncbi:MAG: phospholipase A [Dysgonomonas mossii]|uniref:phospholipase A n=1 Tax=Dysgonomonas mossii TaxID=163665 RepID=UPI003993E490
MFKLLLSLTMVLIISSNMRAQTTIIGDTLEELKNRQLKEVSIFEEEQIEVDEEDILKQIDNMPAFGIYRDNYFTTGVPLNQSINKNTADALFQVSIRHRLTKSRLPFNTFLYLTYTQKSYWDIYDKSAPFRDNNYNQVWA